jgi:3-oxoacyl-[acyl-carrier-protein] synthase II
MNNRNHIAITGIGLISSMGVGRHAFWKNCRNARTGLKEVTSFDTHLLRSNIAGIVEGFHPGQYMKPSVYRRLSRISRMAVSASIEAIADSGLNLDNIDLERVGVIMGTAYGATSRVEEYYISLLKDGPRGAQPFLFPETVPNAPASHIAIYHQITGPNTTFCQNDLSAENAILYARNLLLNDLVDVVLVGGAEEISDILYSCYDAVGALNRVKIGESTFVRLAPGSGIVLGEGAGILVMERETFAIERGARMYGVIRSGVITGGKTRIGHYETEGAQMRRAMVMAMEYARVVPHEIDQIDVSANFSSELDQMESAQIKDVFGKGSNDDTRVTPLKYLMGDFGGAGIIRAAAILLSLYHQTPLPCVSINALLGEPEYALEWHLPPKKEIWTTLMTSSTFGGGSASLIFAKK